MRVESYRYRGLFAALLGVLLLLLPPAPFKLAGYAGILFLVVAVLLRVWARMHIGEHSRGNELVCSEFVRTGPYRFVKHPLYLSNFMAGVAFAFFHVGFSLGALGFCVVYGGFLFFLACRENDFLISCPISNVSCSRQSIIRAVVSDRFTWFWQIVLALLVFLRKNAL